MYYNGYSHTSSFVTLKWRSSFEWSDSRASLNNAHAVTVFCLTLVLRSAVSVHMIPIDISAGVQEPGCPGPRCSTRVCRHRVSRRTSPTGWSRWVGQANRSPSRQEIAVDRRGEHRPAWTTSGKPASIPMGSADPGQLAGIGGRAEPSARHSSSAGRYCRSTPPARRRWRSWRSRSSPDGSQERVDSV